MKLQLTTLLILLSISLSLSAQEQVYNMNFDQWHKDSGTWYPYPEKATAQQKVWDSANKGLSIIRSNTTTPDNTHLAPGRNGGFAAKIQSRSVFGIFVSGNLFTGIVHKTSGTSGAVMTFGTPFTSRPKSLSGWYHYQPGTVNYVKAPYKDRKGKMDEGIISISLLDCKSLKAIDTAKERFVEAEKNPDCVGFGKMILKEDTKGYVKFELNFEYKNDKTPTYVVIIATSSRLGEFFTGSSDSVLYVDEWQFNY